MPLFSLVWKASYVNHAIEREKEIKGWTRLKKIKLIEEENPDWFFLNKDIMEWPPIRVDWNFICSSPLSSWAIAKDLLRLTSCRFARRRRCFAIAQHDKSLLHHLLNLFHRLYHHYLILKLLIWHKGFVFYLGFVGVNGINRIVQYFAYGFIIMYTEAYEREDA